MKTLLVTLAMLATMAVAPAYADEAYVRSMEKRIADLNEKVTALEKENAKLKTRLAIAVKPTDKTAYEQRSATAAPTPRCNTPTREGDASCWMMVENHRNCYAWHWKPADDSRFVSWSGPCRGGRAAGYGGMRYAGGEVAMGKFEDGLQWGQWIMHGADDRRGKYFAELYFFGGAPNDKFVIQYADGTGLEGNFVNGSAPSCISISTMKSAFLLAVAWRTEAIFYRVSPTNCGWG